MLPEGFTSLVAITIKDWKWDALPKKDSEIWNNLLNPLFLGKAVRSAQASYIKQLLEPFMTSEVAKQARTDPEWSMKLMKIIETELNSISGTLGEGLKRAILNIVAKDVQDYEISRTIDTALTFFERHNVCVNKLKEIKDDNMKTKDLVDRASREIHNVSYIKAVLWMYDCGIAYHIVPPNSHVKRFLNECGYPRFGWVIYDQPADWEIFTLASNKMCEVAKIVSKDLAKAITAKQAQLAVWYLQTSRGLLSRKYAKRLTPNALINFLKTRSWGMEDLSERLSDIEQLEELTQDFKIFLG